MVWCVPLLRSRRTFARCTVSDPWKGSKLVFRLETLHTTQPTNSEPQLGASQLLQSLGTFGRDRIGGRPFCLLMCPLCPVQSTRSSCFLLWHDDCFHMSSVLSCFFRVKNARQLHALPPSGCFVECLSHGNSMEDHELCYRRVSHLHLVRVGWLDDCSQDECQGHVPMLGETGRSQAALQRMSLVSLRALALRVWRRYRWLQNGRFAHCSSLAELEMVSTRRKRPVLLQIFHTRTRTAWRKTMSAIPRALLPTATTKWETL